VADADHREHRGPAAEHVHVLAELIDHRAEPAAQRIVDKCSTEAK
jgi:hypothetical protein